MEAAESKMILRDSIPKWIRWALPNRWKVVQTLSAGQYFGEPRILPDTDHFSIVKPSGFFHPSHQFLVTFTDAYRTMLASSIPGHRGNFVLPRSDDIDATVPARVSQQRNAPQEPQQTDPPSPSPVFQERSATDGSSAQTVDVAKNVQPVDEMSNERVRLGFNEPYEFALNGMYKTRDDSEKFARQWMVRTRPDFEAFKRAYDYASTKMYKTRADSEKFAYEMIQTFKSVD
jgi:hypothetical protein